MANVGDNIRCYKCNAPTLVVTKKQARYNTCPPCLKEIEKQ